MSEFENESPDHVRARLKHHVRRGAIEVLLSLGFLFFVYVADRPDLAGEAAPAAAVLGAAAILVLWFFLYVRWHRTHDEFERTLELQSVALAAGVTIVLATSLGLAEIILGGPSMPMVFIAPAFSGIYSVVRVLMGRAYR